MRGVISAGAVTALEHLGLAQRFDAVYGVSAGACAKLRDDDFIVSYLRGNGHTIA